MSEPTSGHAIETMQVEERRYPPSPEFSKQANAKPDIYGRDSDEFWTEESKRVTFFTPWNEPGRQAQRLLQLRRPPRGGRTRCEGRLFLGRRARG